MVSGEERAGLILFPSNICKQWVREELIAKEYLFSASYEWTGAALRGGYSLIGNGTYLCQ